MLVTAPPLLSSVRTTAPVRTSHTLQRGGGGAAAERYCWLQQLGSRAAKLDAAPGGCRSHARPVLSEAGSEERAITTAAESGQAVRVSSRP